MRLGTANNAQEERLVVLDPRTKLYMLLLFNVIMFSSATESMAVILKTLLAALAFLILLNAGKTKIAWIYLALYVLASHCEWVLGYFSGMSVVGFLVRFFTVILARMMPGLMVAYAILSTTKVSAFVAAMERLHLSQKIVVPFAVMFRFFPTIAEEYRSIQDAMRLRGIGLRCGPVAILEYRLVPLIVSVVKIGDELSAAAVTRGLGGDIPCTHYCRIGFGIWDGILFIVMTAALVLYLSL